MNVNLELINGVSAGIEFITADEEIPHNTIIIDVLIIRIMVIWP